MCSPRRSQHRNKAKALELLARRVGGALAQRRAAEESAQRLSLRGSGDRSERIRTYNFPQGRVTDHRIGATLYTLDKIIEGDLNDLLDRCGAHFEALALQQAEDA